MRSCCLPYHNNVTVRMTLCCTMLVTINLFDFDFKWWTRSNQPNESPLSSCFSAVQTPSSAHALSNLCCWKGGEEEELMTTSRIVSTVEKPSKVWRTLVGSNWEEDLFAQLLLHSTPILHPPMLPLHIPPSIHSLLLVLPSPHALLFFFSVLFHVSIWPPSS